MDSLYFLLFARCGGRETCPTFLFVCVFVFMKVGDEYLMFY